MDETADERFKPEHTEEKVEVLNEQNEEKVEVLNEQNEEKVEALNELNEEKVEVLNEQNAENVELPSSNDVDNEIHELTDELLPNLNVGEHEEEVYWQTAEWKSKKHVFVLSSAGKPIYSRHGNEDDLVALFGVMQAIVSVVLDSDDELQSIHTENTHFTFLRKSNIYLVSVSSIPLETTSITKLQLTYVYNQILSILTLTQLTRIFDQYNNFDLRRLLSGSERLINNLVDFTENDPGFFFNAVECLPLASSARDVVVQAITSSCQKIKNLLFAILLAGNQLVVLIRMKKYNLLPSDLHLILNLVCSSQSFRTAEGWTPICLPDFDASGYVQAHVSYLTEECQACLLLVTIDRELFFTLSEAKQKIVEKLQKSNVFEQINESIQKSKIRASEFGISKLRHFVYKNKTTNQFVYPKYEVPYHEPESQKSLLHLYSQLYQQVNSSQRPLKVIFQQLKTESVLGWDTKGFELYLVFEPFVTKSEAINAVNKLLKCMKKEEDRLFIGNSATF